MPFKGEGTYVDHLDIEAKKKDVKAELDRAEQYIFCSLTTKGETEKEMSLLFSVHGDRHIAQAFAEAVAERNPELGLRIVKGILEHIANKAIAERFSAGKEGTA